MKGIDTISDLIGDKSDEEIVEKIRNQADFGACFDLIWRYVRYHYGAVAGTPEGDKIFFEVSERFWAKV